MAEAMKIAIYSPYLPKHAGGGEKHLLTTAWYLAQAHQVFMLIPSVPADLADRVREYERLFNLDLAKLQWVASPLAAGVGNPLTRWQETRQYDAFWYATDGSVFLCGASKSILHIQIPFTNRHASWFARQKLASWKVRNCNSQFTQQVVEQAWQIKVPFVHYPYVDTARLKLPNLAKKKNQIIAVGRFFDPAHTDVHAKRQDLLLEAFLTGYQKYGWDKRRVSLLLVGGIDPGEAHTQFVRRLKHRAKGYPVQFLHDVSYGRLHRLYDESAIFWHAAGYGIDEESQPQRVEHFGMSTIEAMAHGCIPVVVNRGGLKESVDHEVNGYRFETTEELERLTDNILKSGTKTRAKIGRAARAKAQEFSLERFCQTIDTMLEQ